MEESQQGFIVFAKGIGDFTAQLLLTDFPILIVSSEEQASGIISALKDTGYSDLEFSFQPFTGAAQIKRAAHELLIDKALDGHRGDIARDLCEMAKEIFRRSGGRRVGARNAGLGSVPSADPGEGEGNAGAGSSPGNRQAGKPEARPTRDTYPKQNVPEAGAMQSLLGLYTNNVSNERMEQAAKVLESTRTTNEKLEALDKLLKIPLCSAQDLADLIGPYSRRKTLSKTAIIRSPWWQRNRAGKRAEVVDEREQRMKEKGKRLERAQDGN